jgi:hypothetical protein
MRGTGQERPSAEVAPRTDTRRLVLELAGAAAGIAVFVALVGGGVISARLHSLGLPIDSTLAVLPRETVLIAGVRVLSGGLVAALVIIVVLWTIGSGQGTTLPGGNRLSRMVVLYVVVLGLGVVPLLAFTLASGVTTRMALASAGAALVATGVLVLVLRRSATFGQLCVGIFVVVATLGGVLAFARAWNQPIALDFADVQLRDGGRTNGFLLGESSSVVVLAPDVLDRTIGRTVAIPRDQVVDLRLSRLKKKARPIGPDPVSSFTVDVSDFPRARRGSEHAIQQTLLRIRLSAQWKHSPLLFRQSIRAWRGAFDEFVRGGHPAPDEHAQNATLEDLNEHTPLFAGKIVITSGRVLEATPWAEEVPQTIVLRKPDSERYLATCDVWRPRSSPLKPGSDVRLRGLVIAAGIFVSGAGTERNRVAMVCSRARLLPPRSRST